MIIDHPPGHHALLDLTGIGRWLNAEEVEALLRAAASACGATVLSINIHPFGADHALTGIAVLAESHISLHAWPELDYVALDIFLCGTCDPRDAVPVLIAGFAAKDHRLRVIARGPI